VGGNTRPLLLMKIKYTGLQEKIFIDIRVKGKDYKRHFERNIWTDVGDLDVAKSLLKSPFFLCEENFKFKIEDNEDSVILLKRCYALGDLIQLVPVIKYMKRKLGYKFALWTSIRYAEVMKWFNIFEDVYADLPRKKYKNFFILDGVLESDHSLSNGERELHRIKIFERFFNVEVDYYDFTPELKNGKALHK
jgi:hypothetical protein